MKKIFVTGSNGFVGKALIPFLKNKDFEVVAATRDLYGDFSNQENWEKFLSGVDGVVHLAARVHIMNEYSANPDVEFQKMNVEATLNLALACKKMGVKRFVYLSSVKVNGEATENVPYKASDIPAPQDAYGRSKARAEEELLKLHELGGFEIVVIRPPLIYGPGVKANFKSLMSLIEKGYPLPFGKIRNKRSLVSVLNLCDFIALTLVHPKAAGEIYLVKDSQDYSLKEIIVEIAKALNKPTRLVSIPASLMKIILFILGKKNYSERLFGNLHLDISKNREQLDWIPPYTFQETFKK